MQRKKNKGYSDNVITLKRFLKGIKYTPKFCGKDLCGVRIVLFRKHNNMEPSLEFGTIKESGGQYLYFEIIDFKNYVDGDFIPLNDFNRRKFVYNGMLTEKNLKNIIDFINNALKKLYGGSKGKDISE